ncbi:MAG: hypothetical protein QNJ08_11135 [Crocosphaera sp.]|nr:hypothetical protein [Crocosphaera sp.]
MGTIEVNGQTLFTFEGTAGEDILFNNLDDDSSQSLRLYDSANQLISSPFNRPITLENTDRYLVVLRNDNFSNLPEDFNFQLLDVAEANPLIPNAPVMGNLDANGQTLFTFEGTAEQKIVFNNLDDDSSQSLSLYNTANQTVSRSLSFNSVITLNNTETYLVVLTNNNNVLEDFNFEILLPQTTTEMLNFGEIINETIDVPGDEFIYTFDGTIGQQILFDGISRDNSRIHARLVNPSGVNVFSNQDVNSDRNPLTLSEAGTYQLIVDADNNATGNFSFQLLDDQSATELIANSPEMGTIEVNGQTLFTFEGTAGEDILFNNLDDDLNQDIILYNSVNQRQSFNFNEKITLGTTGTYLVAIVNDNSSDTPEDFNFELVFPETTEQPLTLNEIVSETLQVPGDEFIYTFNGTVDQRILFDGISSDSFRIDARLINPSGVNVFSNQNLGSDRHPITLTEAGTYQLIVNDRFNNTTGNFSFQLLDADIATPLTVATPTMGTIDGNSQSLFTFEGEAGQRIVFDNLDDDFSQFLRLYDSANQQTFVNFNQPLILNSTDSYLVVLGNNNGNNTSEDYHFQVATPQTATEMLTFGEVVDGTLDSPGSEVIYTFDGSVGQRILFDGMSGDNFNIDARLVSPRGVNIFSNQNVNSDRHPITLTEAGTYQLIVDADNNATGNFSFQLLDDQSATELTANSPQMGTLEANGQSLFTFEGTAGQRVSFDNLDDDFSQYLTLYDSTNRRIFVSLNESITLDTTGTYLVTFTNSNFRNTPEDYHFQLVIPQTTTETLTLGEVVNGTLDSLGDEIKYTFDGTLGQRLFFDRISGDAPSFARLVSPSGVNGLSINLSNLGNPVTLIETGTYQLILGGGFGNATGDFSFRLLDVANATPLMINSPVMGNIAVRSSELFTFEGTEGDRIIFNSLDDDSSQSLRVYDTGNNSILFSFGSPTILESTGTYIVALFHNNSNQSIEDYNFNVRFPVTTVESLTIGETVTGNIDEPGNEDIYRFEGTTGQKLYFDGLSPDASEFSAAITITSPSGGRIPNVFTLSTSSDSSAPFTLVEDGIYELTVRSSPKTGNYRFRLLDAANGRNIDVDTLVEGTLTPGDSTDLFTFEGTEDQSIFLNEILGFSSTSLTIYGPGNQVLGDESSLRIKLPTNDTYLVVLEGIESTTPLNYSFKLEAPNIIPNTLTIGSQVEGTINDSSEQISYRFEGIKGQRLLFDGLDNNPNFNVRLLSPSDQSLFLGTSTANDSQPISLLQTGTYELIVNGLGEATGDFSFQLLDLATAMDLSLNTEIHGTLDSGKQTKLFSFEGQAGQTVRLDDLVANNGFEGSYTLYNGGNEWLTSTEVNDPADLTVTLTGDGRYFLLVQGASNHPVEYRFQLTETAFDDPGDPIGTEIMIGEIIDSDFTVAGEVDTYLFEGVSGQQLMVDLLNNFSDPNVRISLVSPTASSNDFFAPVSIDSDPVTLIEDGVYQLKFEGFNPGNYRFRLLDIANATPITVDTLKTGTFEADASVAIFTFEGGAGQQLLLKNNTFGYFGNIYGPDDGDVDNNNQLFTLAEEGTYTLVLSSGFNNNPVEYSFELITVTPTVTNTPLILGETVTGSIDQLGEADVYTFNANPGQRLYFDGLDSFLSGGATISLLSPSGATISNLSNAFLFGRSTSNNSLPFTLIEGGTYELRVTDSDIVTYNFRLLDTVQATEINLNTNVQVTLDSGSKTELFAFNGTKDQTLVLTADSFGANYRIYYSSANRSISVSNGEFTLPLDGSYLVLVEGYSSDNTPNEQNFRLQERTIIPASLTLGNTVNGTIANAGEQIRYTFEGTAGQRLIYDGISGDANINVRLVSPSGQDLFETFFNTEVNRDRDPITLIENGTYTLIVDAEGDTTGEFSFRLYS